MYDVSELGMVTLGASRSNVEAFASSSTGVGFL
jgi:hypothetical protein